MYSTTIIRNYNIMYIKVDNLVIRSAATKDAKILSHWWNDGKIMEHAGFPNGLGITEQSIIDRILKEDENINRLLILEIDSSPIGEMNYKSIDDKQVKIGIKICISDMQQKGYGPQFLKMLITNLFFDKTFEKIVLDTNVNNLRAQHVYENIGFIKVAVQENSWKNQLGKFQSTVIYELYKENFII